MGTCEWKNYGGLMSLEFSTRVTSEEVGVAAHPETSSKGCSWLCHTSL